MRRVLHIAAPILLASVAFVLMTSYSRLQTAEKGGPAALGQGLNPPSSGLPQLVKAIDMNRPFEFAGEAVPVSNQDVRERLDRELIVNSYRHSVTMLNIKNAHKYFPIMEPILRRNQLPDDFKYIAVAESDLQNVVSPAGARGIWQFMRSMAEHYGLEVSDEVDERYHVEKATQAACEYLLDTRRRFKNWTLTAASYNMGETRLIRELNVQGVESYYDLHLNEETSRYIFRLIAFKEIIGNPKAFGFYLEEKDLYPPLDQFRLVKVDGPIPSLADFAREQGTTYRLLKVYNPWLLGARLSNPGKKVYEIKIPK